MIIGLACDHAGFELKETLVGYLMALGYGVKDYGCNSSDSVDYPDYANALAEGITNGECNLAIAICGSGNGISMALNRHSKVRAALCWTKELAALARAHNNANVCSLPARFITEVDATAIVDTFLAEEFEGGRHQGRIDKML